MEFWGVEVKAGQPLKVNPEYGKLIHISQASLGEVKDVKGAKNVPLRLKINDKNFVVGCLSAEDRPQLIFDLVFEREFELSHDWKNGSVYFIGYSADDIASDGDDSIDEFDDESEEDLVDIRGNGVTVKNAQAAKSCVIAAMSAAKEASAAAKKGEPSAEVKKGEPSAEVKKGEPSDSSDDDDEEDSESDSDDDMALDGALEGDSSDDDSGEDSEEDDSSEEELPPAKESKKRPAEPAQQTHVSAKKAKSSTPDKTGVKKGPISTPFPSKGAGKAPAGKTPPGNKSKQSPKSGGQFSGKPGGQFSGKSGNKSFNSKKGKHGGK